MEVVSMRIQKKVKKKVEREAKKACLTTSQYIRKVIFKALKLDLRGINNGN